MAERRMFAKTIIDSDAFIDMPLSTQALYFHLSMRADDDGFINNSKKIQRMIGASDDDLKLLFVKNFVIPFESGIVVIKHWKIHNYIRNDRKKDTVYPEEMALLTTKNNGAYSLKLDTPVLEQKTCESDETLRQKAYRESPLPYSFEYKIRQAFIGKKCPVCGSLMQRNIDEGIITENRIPTIQHNLPISKGGKHELGNISVICKDCNITLQDTITDKLNSQEVIECWDTLISECQSSDGQMTDKCQLRLGKSSIDKNSIIMSTTETVVEHEENIFIKIILNDGSDYPINHELLNEYKKLYPAVNVEQELRKYAAWSISNPNKRKTKRGILRSINLWLSRAQDQGGTNAINRRSTQRNGAEYSEFD